MNRLAYAALWIYAFTVPIDGMIDFGEPIGSIARLTGLNALLWSLLAIAERGMLRPFESFHGWFMGFIYFSMASLLWTADAFETMRSFKTYPQTAGVVWIAWQIATTPEQVVRLCEAVVVGCYIPAAAVLYAYFSGHVMRLQEGERFTAEGWNPNDLALMLCAGVILAFFVFSQERPIYKKVMCIVFLVVGPTAILMTGSRGGAAALSVAITPIVIFVLRKSKGYQSTLRLWMPLVVAAAVLLVVQVVPNEVLSRIASIPEQIKAKDIGDRYLLWIAGIETFASNWLVGVGSGGFMRAAGLSQVVHNTYISVLAETGILGGGCFFAMLWSIRKRVNKVANAQKTVIFCIFGTWLVGAIVATLEMTRLTWMTFALVYGLAAEFSLKRGTQIPMTKAEASRMPS